MKITRTNVFALGGVAVLGTGLVSTLLASDPSSRERTASTARSLNARMAPKAALLQRADDDERRSAAKRARSAGMALGTAASAAADARRARPLESSATGPGSEATPAGAAPSPGATGADAATPKVLTAEERAKLAADLKKVDWRKSLADLVAALKAARADGKAASGETLVEAAEVNLALAQAAQQLGLKGPGAALGDPTVRSVVVPPWLNALGVTLDDAQAAAISSLCLAAPGATATRPTSFLEARQGAIQSRIALEQSFAQVLTPQQMQTYAQNVGDDPLMRPTAQRLNVVAADPNGLANAVVTYWASTFQLAPGSQAAAQRIAAQYVAAALAVPTAAPNLDPEAARVATLARASQLVALQQQAEQALAADATLSPAEQARARKGSTACLQLSIQH